MVKAIPVNPTIFVQIPLHSVRSYMSQFCLYVYKQIKAGSTNGSKEVVWDDVTNRFPFHKAAI